MTDDLEFTVDLDHPLMQAAIQEMKDIILARYPGATFSAGYGEDPYGVYLDATVDVEDTDEVVDLDIDRLLDLQLEHRLALHVIPLRTPERIAAMLRGKERAAAEPAIAGPT